MKKLASLAILLFCAITVSAQQKQRIAVLPSVGDLDPTRLVLLTDKVREIATQHLPMENFNILKQDVITKMIGEEELYRACKEGVCIGDLAKRTNSNYGARGDVIKLDNSLVLKFELYSVDEDAIFETFTVYDLKDFRAILKVLETRLPKTFQKVVSAYNSGSKASLNKIQLTAPSEPAPKADSQPLSMPVAREPEPEPPQTDTMTAAVQPKSEPEPKPEPEPDDSHQSAMWIYNLNIKAESGAAGLLKPPPSGIKNPAFINEENYMSLRFSYSLTTVSSFFTNTGFSMPLSLYDAVGVSWGMMGTGGFYATDSEGNLIEYKPKIQDATHLLTLTYARNVWNRLTVGGEFNVVSYNVLSIDSDVAARTGFIFDIGMSWKLASHKTFGNHILGISTDNIFNVILNTDEKFAADLRFSLLSDFWDSKIYYGADFLLDDILPPEDAWGNTKPSMPWVFSQELGFHIFNTLKFHTLIGFDVDGFDHYGFAFGANMPLGILNFRGIEGVVQFMNIIGNDGGIISFYARTEFGKYKMGMVPK